MNKKQDYWFPAKKAGWGWGPPSNWKGWTALTVYVGLVIGICFQFSPDEAPILFVLSLVLLSVIFVGVCLRTSEPPRWR